MSAEHKFPERLQVDLVAAQPNDGLNPQDPHGALTTDNMGSPTTPLSPRAASSWCCFTTAMLPAISLLTAGYSVCSYILTLATQLNSIAYFLRLLVSMAQESNAETNNTLINDTATTLPAITTSALTTGNATEDCNPPVLPVGSLWDIVGTVGGLALLVAPYLVIIQFIFYLQVTWKRMQKVQENLIKRQNKPSKCCANATCASVSIGILTTLFMMLAYVVYIVTPLIINAKLDNSTCENDYTFTITSFSKWMEDFWLVFAMAATQDFGATVVRFKDIAKMFREMFARMCCKDQLPRSKAKSDVGSPDEKKSYVKCKIAVFVLSTLFYLFIQMMKMINVTKITSFLLYGIDRSGEDPTGGEYAAGIIFAAFNVLPGAFNAWFLSDRSGQPPCQQWCNQDRKNNFVLKFLGFFSTLQVGIFYFVSAYKSIIYNFPYIDPIFSMIIAAVNSIFGLIQSNWFGFEFIGIADLLNPQFSKGLRELTLKLFCVNPFVMCREQRQLPEGDKRQNKASPKKKRAVTIPMSPANASVFQAAHDAVDTKHANELSEVASTQP